ncbi:MAG: type II secretion system minor pseudopilin GspH [Mitsuaria chitosanitabida]|uniref:type II secretion system minor pseudopilin GspH n=1 Tax=Roseateles chitosanitabidus TaxID=65048 RepID=UPI001B2B5950|nr:type II secretion system minor pseudopilin GspH [Roseateles chitosanitabidus]MBO9685299.1 type II secretion system minor pseudopilin GspH [Roseateles chitosanitabidus]
MDPTTSPRGRARGFTLIEVMVVLVIIGIATAAISLSIAPDPAAALRLDARELAQRLAAAQQEVRIDGRVIAWEARGDGYQFARGTWTAAPDSVVPVVTTAGELDRFDRDEALRPRRWRAGTVQVIPATPLLLTSEWVGDPLTVELRQGGYAITVERDATGRFEIGQARPIPGETSPATVRRAGHPAPTAKAVGTAPTRDAGVA